MLLVGDIGGTKTVLALISKESGVRVPIRHASFPSNDFDSLTAIIADFLKGIDINHVTSASFGVAGPVIEDQAEITNLPWIIDAKTIRRLLDIESVFLLNDLESIANAIPHLETSDLATINPGQAEPEGAIAVIAPGTGLGEAFLTWNGRFYQAHPSEGGHASFAPVTPEQIDLLEYLQPRFGHVSYERVCSGSGIPNIYQFLRDSGRFSVETWLSEALASTKDPTPVIANGAIDGRSGICVATMQLFVEILANEASNMALKVLATGGVYIGGGIPPRILSQLQITQFMETFNRKGRMSHVVDDMPIHVILNPQAALYGAAYYGLEMEK